MIAFIVILGGAGLIFVLAQALLGTAGEIEASPDTAENQKWRQSKWMYQIDNVWGQLNILDLLFGLISNAVKPKSKDAKGSKWRLAKVIVWRGPDGLGVLEVRREFKRYGIIVIWHGFNGDSCWFYVRETQKAHALYRLDHIHAGGPSWAEQANGAEKPEKPQATATPSPKGKRPAKQTTPTAADRAKAWLKREFA